MWTTETIDKVLINHIDKDKEYRTRFLSVQEAIRTKMQCDKKTYVSRWSDFHVPIHSVVFAMDKYFCRRDMEHGVKKDIWSVMEDFSKVPGGQDLNKMKS